MILVDVTSTDTSSDLHIGAHLLYIDQTRHSTNTRLEMADQQLQKLSHTLQQAYDRNDLPATGKQLTVLKVSYLPLQQSSEYETKADRAHICF